MKKLLSILCALLALASAALADEVSVVVPEAYRQAGTLPLYRAVTRSRKEQPLYDQVQPQWFNQSGEPEYENASRRGRYDHYTFPDENSLYVGPESIDYNEYDGVMQTIPLEEGGPVETLPRPSLKYAVGELAMGARRCWPKLDAQPQLDKTQLGGFTLAQAQARLDALLNQIGLTGYQCVYALDMSVERIRSLGESYKRGLDSRNTPFPAYETAAEEDEGFFLYYEKFLDGVSLHHEGEDSGAFYVSAYLTADGLHLFQLRETHVIGRVYSTPERLLSAGEVRAAFEKGNAKRQRDGFLDPQLISLTLTYSPARAPQKKDGVVMAPAWLAHYTYQDGRQKTGWAWYSALDGSLLGDCYTR